MFLEPLGQLSSLKVDGIVTYSASYQISSGAAKFRSVSNTLIVIGSTQVSSNTVSDTSDDGIDNDSNTTDDPTETLVENIQEFRS